jgi:hypothetical protein
MQGGKLTDSELESLVRHYSSFTWAFVAIAIAA